MAAAPCVDEVLLARLLRDHHRLVTDLKRRRTKGAYDVALATVENLKRVVGGTRWRKASEIIDTVKLVGADLVRAQPVELSAGNIVRRVLHVIREEYREKLSSKLGENRGAGRRSGPRKIRLTLVRTTTAPPLCLPLRALAASLRQRSPSPVTSPSPLSTNPASDARSSDRYVDPVGKEFGSVEIKGINPMSSARSMRSLRSSRTEYHQLPRSQTITYTIMMSS